MPKRVSTTCKCSRYNPYMGLLDALPLSAAANVPTTPDNRDSRSCQHQLLSSPSTTTTAPTMSSRSKVCTFGSLQAMCLVARTLTTLFPSLSSQYLTICLCEVQIQKSPDIVHYLLQLYRLFVLPQHAIID